VRLDEYVTLGRSGLRVSPVCIGTMTFGNPAGWGSGEAEAKAIFLRYVEAGGNFVDTADLYAGGRSEEILGRLVAEVGRDRVVLATKFGFGAQPGNPNAGGAGRANARRAIEGSLRRLRTDHVDLYWLHAWDGVTPAEELVATFDALVREGKVRHVGLSDVPAWFLARAQTWAEAHALERICALQLEYSLVERTIEREHVPAAAALGVGICPWSPLASGFLTGKYRRDGAAPGGRLDVVAGSKNPVFHKLTDRNFAILDALLAVSEDLGRPPAEVALAWVLRRPGVTSTLVGATKVSQLEANLAALALELPSEAARRLEEASAPPPAHPYVFLEGELSSMVHGGTSVRAWSPAGAGGS
jgi:aryl-alcohol dehydrogenase-like predicted oxidoreductase